MTNDGPAAARPGASGTGDPAVDAIVARVAEVAELPTAGHIELYASLMEGLQRELDADPVAAVRDAAPAGGP